jgi:pimeloyl-ACP methyl ester carboxylesterase
MNKKVITLLLASLLVLTTFVGHVSTAWEGEQQMSPHSISLAEGSGLSRAVDGSALFSELGQNGSYKSTGIATSITFVNCPSSVWSRFYDPYYANTSAQLFRRNPISSQWEYTNQSKDTNADGYVAFQGLKESKPGIYDYVITCQGQHTNPLKILVTYPVVFVHGWDGSSDEMLYPWTNMTQALDNAGFVKNRDYFLFNYDSKDDPRTAADGLQNFIKERKVFFHDRYQYDDSKFTIVCHSEGALVTRWYMEREGGGENVVQWIGIAPTNHGAALADLAPDVLLSILNPFIGKEAVEQRRTDSDTVRGLEAQSLAPGVTYRVIVGNNTNNVKGFGYDMFGLPGADKYYSLPFVRGTTWARLSGCTDPSKGCYYRTLRGDGLIANVQSWIDSADFQSFTGLSHFGLNHNRTVINYVLRCIEDPTTKGQKVGLDNFLYPNDPAAPH